MGWGVVILVVVVGAGPVALGQLTQRRAKASEGQSVQELVGDTPEDLDDVVLWFHSPTCGPCRAMEPAVRPLVHAGKVRAVDVFEEPDLARSFGVMATPTTVRVRAGTVETVKTGFLNQATLESLSA